MNDLIKAIKYREHNIEIYPDIDVMNPFKEDEGLGNFFHWKDYGREQLKRYCELLGYDIDTREKIGKDNKDAVRIDKYEHSQIYYSVAGEGMQCRWDTSHSWAVWYPNKCLLEDLERFKGKARRKRCIELARQACEVFNDWVNGNVYGYMVKDKDGNDIGSCWGFFGDWEGYLLSEAKSNIDYWINEQNKKKQRKLKSLIQNGVNLQEREVTLI